MLDAKLIVIGGDTDMKEVRLKLPATIGRGRESFITLPHPLVSRHHCELFAQEGMLYVRDLGSLNGTFVGSERVTEKEVRPGDLLTVGTVTFRAVYGAMDHLTWTTADTVAAAGPELDTHDESLKQPEGDAFDDDTYLIDEHLADETEYLDEPKQKRFDGGRSHQDDTGPVRPQHKPPQDNPDDSQLRNDSDTQR